MTHAGHADTGVVTTSGKVDVPSDTLQWLHHLQSRCSPAEALLLAVLYAPQVCQAELHLVATGGLGLARPQHASSCYLQHVQPFVVHRTVTAIIAWSPSTGHLDCQAATGYHCCCKVLKLQPYDDCTCRPGLRCRVELADLGLQ